MDPITLFDQASAWTASKIDGASGALDSKTGCEEWDARTVVNHLVQGVDFFEGSAKGEKAAPPDPTPPDVVGDADPVKAYEAARSRLLKAYQEDGALERAGATAGIAFADHLIHGWDLAKGTGQDATMPPELAEAAFRMLDGRLTDENRGEGFKPAVPVPDDASTQEKLLALTGRRP